jgi:16S rRNA (cytidine(1402)-2'-O)-methyltransferase
MLYMVATPIGNLGDISQRALETLRQADIIASEDTRHTGLLLKRFGIDKPQLSLHEHNERLAAERVIALLREGQTVALVTDAGTPGISDPGFVLVQRCIEEGLPFTMVPGPVGVRDGAGAQRPADAQLYLSRLPAAQARPAPALLGRGCPIPPHADLLRKPAPDHSADR